MTNEMVTTGDLAGKTVLISAGGTGGHVYPALAIANQLRELGAKIAWLGTQAGVEARLVPESEIDLHLIFIQGLRGNGITRLIKSPIMVFLAVMQAKKIVKAVKPDIFVGFGGFASGPGAVAAKLSGVPVLVHEQNAAMGMTNKIVSWWAKRVLLAFPIVGKSNKVVGNPIRRCITTIPFPIVRIRQNAPFRLLVIGGSLGAKAINDIIPSVLKDLLHKVELTHQTGEKTYIETRNTYQQLGLIEQVKVIAYIDDIGDAYADADLVIARSGALTVSEIASVGLAAIFIPLPHAVDNHQYLNAQFLAAADAAIIIEQKDLDVTYLRQTIESLLDGKTLLSMANNARVKSHEKALGKIIIEITEVIDANEIA
ncbi:MAG: undecaprenyldiphospho-muramoylpentapeptide beta-N-acetylglucosaminyltransferase [Ostreibacterium sp.]